MVLENWWDMLFLTIVLTGGWVREGRVSGVKVCREFRVSMHTTCIGFYDIGMNCFLSVSCVLQLEYDCIFCMTYPVIIWLV